MKIDEYAFGRIVIDGKTYTSDVIIYPDRIDASWWRKEGHLLHFEDLEKALAARPAILVVGTGAYGVMKVPRELVDRLAAAGFEVIVERTAKAVESFNRRQGAGTVLAALHLTC